MIDRERRSLLARALRQLIDGEITTDQFELIALGPTEDPAIDVIWSYGISLFHGLYPYRLRGRHALDRNKREVIERCILFLNTDFEYKWPPYPKMIGWYFALLASVLLGITSLTFFSIGLFRIITGALVIIASLVGLVVNVLWERIERKNAEAFWRSGEKEYWPFFNKVQYEEAVALVTTDGP